MAPGGGFGFDLGDLFGSSGTGGRLGDLLGGMFGGRGARQQRPRRGTDVETEATLSFSDAVDGVTVPLRLTGEGPCPTCHGTGAKSGTVPRVCPSCEGSGQASKNLGSFGISEPCKECRGRGLIVDDPCPSCSGSGRAMSTRTIQARIPAGVKDGQRIRLKAKGAPGERGGPAGDLYVHVHVKPHPIFGRSGDNLTITVPVTFPEAVLGAEIKVPTHQGVPVTVRIPPGTPNGRTLRVRGRGTRRSDGTTGDLLVTVEVTVPQNVNGKAAEALEQFQQALGEPQPEGRPAAAEHGGAEMTFSNPFGLSDDTPVYVISVAAQLSGLHPQTLRSYDRLGLVSPGRAAGRRPPLFDARHPAAARGSAALAGTGREPVRYQADPRTRERPEEAPAARRGAGVGDRAATGRARIHPRRRRQACRAATGRKRRGRAGAGPPRRALRPARRLAQPPTESGHT